MLFRYRFLSRFFINFKRFWTPKGSQNPPFFNIDLQKGDPGRVLRITVGVLFRVSILGCILIAFWLPFAALFQHKKLILAHLAPFWSFLAPFWSPFGSMLVHFVSFWRPETDPAPHDTPKPTRIIFLIFLQILDAFWTDVGGCWTDSGGFWMDF